MTNTSDMTNMPDTPDEPDTSTRSLQYVVDGLSSNVGVLIKQVTTLTQMLTQMAKTQSELIQRLVRLEKTHRDSTRDDT